MAKKVPMRVMGVRIEDGECVASVHYKTIQTESIKFLYEQPALGKRKVEEKEITVSVFCDDEDLKPKHEGIYRGTPKESIHAAYLDALNFAVDNKIEPATITHACFCKPHVTKKADYSAIKMINEAYAESYKCSYEVNVIDRNNVQESYDDEKTIRYWCFDSGASKIAYEKKLKEYSKVLHTEIINKDEVDTVLEGIGTKSFVTSDNKKGAMLLRGATRPEFVAPNGDIKKLGEFSFSHILQGLFPFAFYLRDCGDLEKTKEFFFKPKDEH